MVKNYQNSSGGNVVLDINFACRVLGIKDIELKMTFRIILILEDACLIPEVK